MTRDFFRVNGFAGVLPVAAMVTAVAIVAQPATAKTAREVAKVAVPTTVQINNSLAADRGGSGVIIARDDNTYTVLTANHVVKNPNSEYTIRTSRGQDYAVTSVRGLVENEGDPDLAIVTFESTEEEYPVAPISDSDRVEIGSGIYISGYPLPGTGQTEREYAFTNGQINNVNPRAAEGYVMRYDAVTRRGMSGGPVFDVSGRVVGIHGQGEVDGAIQSEAAAGGEIPNKIGFNRAVPINTFMAMMPQMEMNRNQLQLDEKPPENVDAEEVSQADASDWFQSFAAAVAVDLIREAVPIRLPF